MAGKKTKKREKRRKKKVQRKNFNLKREYKESWNYIKESRKFIYIAIVLFSVFALIGFLIPAPESLVEQILKFIDELLQKTSGLPHAELVKFILLNNLKSSFVAMILGIFLGIFPMVSIIANGYLLGFVSSMSVQTGGAFILFRLLPHGIFELPAVFISMGLGLKLGMFVFQKDKRKALAKYFINSLRTFLLIVVPLLIIAAAIEGSLIFLFR